MVDDKTLTAGELARRIEELKSSPASKPHHGDFERWERRMGEVLVANLTTIIAALESKSAVGGTEIENRLRKIAALFADAPSLSDDVATLTAAADELRRMREERATMFELMRRMNYDALPKFNWGKSALDAKAIKTLNEFGIFVEREHEATATTKDPQP